MVRVFLYIIVGFIIIIFQMSNLVNSFKIGGIKPNIILSYIVYISLTTEVSFSESISFVTGLMEDIFTGAFLGVNSFTKTVLSFILNRFKTKIFTEKSFSVFIVILLADFLNNFIYFLLISIFERDIDFYMILVKITLPEAFYTAVLSVFLFPIFRRIFKKS